LAQPEGSIQPRNKTDVNQELVPAHGCTCALSCVPITTLLKEPFKLEMVAKVRWVHI